MKMAKIADIAQQIRGVTYRKADASDAAGPGRLPVLRANNITHEGMTYTGLVYVPKAKISKRQLIRKNDILIATSSGSLDVVGKAAKALESFEGGFGAFCKVLRPKDTVDPDYFAQYFKTVTYRRYVSQVAAGANINNLKNEHLDNIQIPLPPLSEQKRIAGILDAADALRAKRRQTLDELDTLIQSTFLDMFGDPVTNPMGWEQVALSQLVEKGDKINYGVVQPGDDHPNGKPLIRVGDFVTGELSLKHLKQIAPEIDKKYSRSRLKGSELLISCVGSIGNICRVPESAIGFNIARAVTRVPLKDELNHEFIMHCLRSEAAQRHFRKETRTVSQPTLNIGLIKTTPVIQPPLTLQQDFATVVESIEAQKARCRAHLDELDTLFSSLQSRAFKGEL